MRTQPGCTVVYAPCSQPARKDCLPIGPGFGDKRHVQPTLQLLSRPDPEMRSLITESGVSVLAVVGKIDLHDDAKAQRGEGARIEFLRAGEVRHRKADVVEHSASPLHR